MANKTATCIADFISDHSDAILERWRELAEERLSHHMDETELFNHLPVFLEDLEAAMRDPDKRWLTMDSAGLHGEQRLRLGVDIGALTEEMWLVHEVVLEKAMASGCEPSEEEILLLSQVFARGTASSVNAYAKFRDKEMAEQASQHFSFVAHELRTPLQTAQYAVALLKRAPDRDPTRQLERLDRSLALMGDLVDDVLVQSKLDSEPDVDMEPVSLEELVTTACDDVSTLAGSHDVSLDCAVEDAEIMGDRKLLLSALTNLLTNGVKYSHEGGTVRVRISRGDERILVEVEDECGGMPDDLPSRLFQPFVQGDDERGGFGLGLVIAKQAVEAHQGAIRVHNRPPDGCCFVIELPARPPESEPRSS